MTVPRYKKTCIRLKDGVCSGKWAPILLKLSLWDLPPLEKLQSKFTFLIGEALESTHSFKYLGIHLSPNLSWQNHVDFVVSAACKSLGFFRRTLRQADSSTKLLAYTTILRPKLEYASFIWNPHQTYLINKLESLQNKAACFITGNYSQQLSITKIKRDLGLLPLQTRRKICLLTFFHQLFHQPSTFSQAHILPAKKIFPRINHKFKVEQPFARTNLLQFSCLHLAISEWNSLPSNIAEITDHSAFKVALNETLEQVDC